MKCCRKLKLTSPRQQVLARPGLEGNAIMEHAVYVQFGGSAVDAQATVRLVCCDVNPCRKGEGREAEEDTMPAERQRPCIQALIRQSCYPAIERATNIPRGMALLIQWS